MSVHAAGDWSNDATKKTGVNSREENFIKFACQVAISCQF